MNDKPFRSKLVEALADCARAAVSDLRRAHPDHHFYYFSLQLLDGGRRPFLCACSLEGLERVVREHTARRPPWSPRELARLRADLKWSTADTPFCFDEQYFSSAWKLIEGHPDDGGSDPEDLLEVMSEALARLDAEGIFGTGQERLGAVINAEEMPPDAGNTKRALRLNPRLALASWLREAAEEP